MTRLKMNLSVAVLLLFVACNTPTPRTSRHTPYCACEHMIAGKVQILQIADQESEQILDLLIEMNGLQKSNFKLCFAKMKGYAGLSTVKDNGAYIYLNPKSLDENNEGLNTYKIYLIAHELGHLLAHHTVLKYQAIDQENECSIFAGAMMAKMHLTLNDALSSAPILRARSVTHPSGLEVQEGIRIGFLHAQEVMDVNIYDYLGYPKPVNILPYVYN